MFAAGGQSPWWVSGLSGFMTMFSAATFVVWGGIAYRLGLVAVIINLGYGIAALLVGYFVAGRWKEFGVKSPSQFIELRYGRGTLHFYTWSMMTFRIIGVGVALYSMAVLLVASMPLAEGNPLRDATTGNLSLTWAILFFGAIVIFYTMIGGLWGVLMTDVLQFIVLNLAVFFAVTLALARCGGWTAFVRAAPERFFALTAPEEGYSWFFLFGWMAVHYFVVGAEWAFVQRFICVPTARDARKSSYLFGVLYLVSPLLWLLPPMIYRVQQPIPDGSTAVEIKALAEQAYINACYAVLPGGMFGLLIAAMFSATASMISSQLNVFAGVLTNDIYRPLMASDASDGQLVRVGRFFSLAIGLAFIGMALSIPYLGGAEKVVIAATSLVIAPLLAPTIWGMFSRAITARAVWATSMTTIVIGGLAKFGFAADGWLVGIRPLQPIAEWAQSNSQSVDLIIGLALPIGTLLLVQMMSHGTAAGWDRVADLAARTDLNRGLAPITSSPMPALIVAYSLLGCSPLMGVLAVFDSQNRFVLLAFAAILAVFGAAILAARSRLTRIERKTTCVET